MTSFPSSLSRRTFFRSSAAFGALAFTVPGLFAEELSKTPRVTEGPFYPDKLPLDTDNDLLIINDGITPAVGEITHLSGKIFGIDGKPIQNATIEIWQVDGKAVISTPAIAEAKAPNKTRTSRVSAASRRAAPANTIFAPSSRWPTLAVPRTSM